MIVPRGGARTERHGNRAGPPLAREGVVRMICDLGRRRWKEWGRYHRRSLSETAVSRLKRQFGNRFDNRRFTAELTEQ